MSPSWCCHDSFENDEQIDGVQSLRPMECLI